MISIDVRKGLEFVVRKLHQDPNPNKDTWLMTEAVIVDQFWTEFEDFRKSGVSSATRTGGGGGPRQDW